MTTTLIFLAGAFVLSLALIFANRQWFGFASQRSSDYREGPTFNLHEHLNGPLVCEGVIYGPTGRVSSRFVADFDANWDGNVGVMREHFRYDSGSTQEREWRLTVDRDGQIKADADDLVGSGHGRQSGPTVKLEYKIRLPESSGGHVLTTTDWMYLVENGSIINRSEFRKYGVKVAELVATMRPREAERSREAA